MVLLIRDRAVCQDLCDEFFGSLCAHGINQKLLHGFRVVRHRNRRFGLAFDLTGFDCPSLPPDVRWNTLGVKDFKFDADRRLRTPRAINESKSIGVAD
jgi:hypothetical protein